MQTITGSDMERLGKRILSVFIFSLALAGFLLLAARGAEIGASVEKVQPASTHFDGTVFFNPGFPPQGTSPQGTEQKRGGSRWIWRWLFGNDWPEWPEIHDSTPGPIPAARVPKGAG